MNAVFDVHPLLVVAMGLAGLPLLGGELRFLGLRREGWILPALGALTALAVLVPSRLPGLGGPLPDGIAAWPWLATWLLVPLLPLLVLFRLAPPRHEGLGRHLVAAPLPLFWAMIDPFAGRVPQVWLPLATGLGAFVLLALLTGAEEKLRQNDAPPGLDGLPRRLLLLSFLLLLQLGLESWAGGGAP
ncbi:MAG: hypothetical protein Q8O14_01620 [bacterium]|nr:hypothetical protein [bacterium]